MENIKGFLDNSTVMIGSITALLITFTGMIAAIMKLGKELKKVTTGLVKTNINLNSQINLSKSSNLDNEFIKPDPALVIKWAHDNKADNPWDLGPKNWEKCLYDLKNSAGKDHKLLYNENGRLKYQ